MIKKLFTLILITALITSVSAAPVINPSVESESIICRIIYTKWICGLAGTGNGGVGPQGPPGIPGNGTGGDINYFNFSGSNLTTISNVTNFFNYTFSEMNQTANMTAGPQGEQGIPGLANMTAGPQGIQGIQGIQGETGLTGAANMTAGPQGEQGIPGLDNMTAGPQGEPGATGGTGGQVLFFHHDPVEDPAGYEGLFPVPAGSGEADETVVVKTGLGQVLVDPYITIAGYPGLTTLPAGLWRFRTYHYVDSAPGITNAVFKVYNRSGATETLLFTATSDDINALTATEYLTSYAQATDYAVSLSDRIVIKVYGQSDHSANIDFHFVYEGSLHTSHVQTPLETLSSLYIRRDGSVNMTGNLNLGSKQITSLITGLTGDTAVNKSYVDAVNATGITDHGALTGLTDDDHTMYDKADGSRGRTGYDIKRNLNDEGIRFLGGTGVSGEGAAISIYGKDNTYWPGYILAFVPNAAKNALVWVFRVAGNTDTPYLDMMTNKIGNMGDPVSAQDAATKNYVDTKQKCGATASVADGGTITHTFGATPTYILTTGTVANNVIDVTATGSTTFTVAIKLGSTGAAGTTQTIYWCVG